MSYSPTKTPEQVKRELLSGGDARCARAEVRAASGATSQDFTDREFLINLRNRTFPPPASNDMMSNLSKEVVVFLATGESSRNPAKMFLEFLTSFKFCRELESPFAPFEQLTELRESPNYSHSSPPMTYVTFHEKILQSFQSGRGPPRSANYFDNQEANPGPANETNQLVIEGAPENSCTVYGPAGLLNVDRPSAEKMIEMAYNLITLSCLYEFTPFNSTEDFEAYKNRYQFVGETCKDFKQIAEGYQYLTSIANVILMMLSLKGKTVESSKERVKTGKFMKSMCNFLRCPIESLYRFPIRSDVSLSFIDSIQNDTLDMLPLYYLALAYQLFYKDNILENFQVTAEAFETGEYIKRKNAFVDLCPAFGEFMYMSFGMRAKYCKLLSMKLLTQCQYYFSIKFVANNLGSQKHTEFLRAGTMMILDYNWVDTPIEGSTDKMIQPFQTAWPYSKLVNPLAYTLLSSSKYQTMMWRMAKLLVGSGKEKIDFDRLISLQGFQPTAADELIVSSALSALDVGTDASVTIISAAHHGAGPSNRRTRVDVVV